MGRQSTGIWTTDDALQIDITQLQKAGLMRQGYITWANWLWSSREKKRAELRLEVYCGHDERYLRLIYTVTRNGEAMDMDYKIGILDRPSNLGIGKVLFLRCPVSLKPCRKLYLAYDSTVFKCREAYRNRIYYLLQLSSKLDRSNDRYWHFKRKIDDLEKIRDARYYAGTFTRRAERMQKLYNKRDEADYLRWLPETYPCALRRSVERLFTG